MKRFLATTAIALVVANGAFAESHVAADSAATDGTMATEAPAMTDSATAPEATKDTMPPADEAMPAETMPADTMPETTAEEMTDTMSNTDITSTNMESADTMGAPGAPMMEKDGYTTTLNADVTAEQLTGIDLYGPNHYRRRHCD
jgi:hypothetical protein